MKNILIFLAPIFLFFNSCIKKECRIAGGAYLFEIPATFSPALDTLNIGDTITVASVFNEFLSEHNTRQSYYLKGFHFQPTTFIYRLDSVGVESKIYDNFRVIISPQYNISLITEGDGSSSIYGEYVLQNSFYSLKYLLIPTKKGAYYLQFGAISYSEQEFEGKCKNLSTNISVNMNKREDNNFYFIDDAKDPSYQLYRKNILEKFNKYGGYAFYVK